MRTLRDGARPAREGRRIARRPIQERLARLDWEAIARSLDERGSATTPALLDAGECAALVRLWADERRFRSRVDMARLRFGVGAYQYFAAPPPPPVAGLRAHRQPLDGGDGRGGALSARAGCVPRALRGPRADAAHPAAPPLHGRRLQLPASGPLRRARLSAPAHLRALPPRRGLRGRRAPARRAAAARAVARRGGRPRARRGGHLPEPPPAGGGRARQLPRDRAPRRQPGDCRRAPEPRHHLPRRRVSGTTLSCSLREANPPNG